MRPLQRSEISSGAGGARWWKRRCATSLQRSGVQSVARKGRGIGARTRRGASVFVRAVHGPKDKRRGFRAFTGFLADYAHKGPASTGLHCNPLFLLFLGWVV